MEDRDIYPGTCIAVYHSITFPNVSLCHRDDFLLLFVLNRHINREIQFVQNFLPMRKNGTQVKAITFIFFKYIRIFCTTWSKNRHMSEQTYYGSLLSYPDLTLSYSCLSLSYSFGSSVVHKMHKISQNVARTKLQIYSNFPSNRAILLQQKYLTNILRPTFVKLQGYFS